MTVWVNFVLEILMACAGAFSMAQMSIAGIGIISASPQKRAEAVSRIKWIAIGTGVAVLSYVLTRFIAYEASIVAPHVTATAPGMSYQPGQLLKLPGVQNKAGIEGWVVNVVFSSLTDFCKMIAAACWALTGFTGPSAMIDANIQDGQSHGYVMGIFPETTWTAMMYVQHSLYIFVAVAALISFVIQGIQIQNAPSSSVAKERVVSLIKSIVTTGFMIGGTPYILGIVNAGVSDLTNYVQGIAYVHTVDIAKANPMVKMMFNPNKLSASAMSNLALFSGNSMLNAIFAMFYSVVNLIMWAVYQWRRVVLAFLITLMPLFYIGFVTGKKPDLALHWWKELIAYMFIPFMLSLLLLVAQVFIGI